MAKKKNFSAEYNALLMLSDGSLYYGYGIGYIGTCFGEICFNTGLTGYQEILSDLSYSGQIINFTFPHIGNVGTNFEDYESKIPAARGLIVREEITEPANFRQKSHLNHWLVKYKITGIAGVDTRAITHKIRDKGPQNVAICYFENGQKPDLDKLKKQLAKQPDLEGLELAKDVSRTTNEEWQQKLWQIHTGFSNSIDHKHKIVAIDYGAKLNILRNLSELNCNVIIVPAETAADDILKLDPDGIFLSNGPGDPAATGIYALKQLAKLVDLKIPIFGICLGHQLLALTLGCRTIKMHQGHRGSNHPVKDLVSGKIEITSQNHGFVVDQNTIPNDVEVTHISLFDNSIEGIKSKTLPVFSVQYHPEASPGPHDSHYLFVRFIQMIENFKKNKGK